MFGLMNAEKQFGKSNDIGKKVLQSSIPKPVVTIEPSFASQV